MRGAKAIATAAVASLELTELTTIDQLEQLRPEWSALAGRCPWATPFQLPEWQLSWWRHLGGGALRAITLRRDGRLVALAPFFVYGHAWEPRHLSLLAAGVSDYEDLLSEPEVTAEATALILRHVAEREPGWDVCEVQELRPGSTLLSAPVSLGVSAVSSPSSICLILQLPATSGELNARLSSRFRRKLRMVTHRLERGGGFEYVLADDATVIELMDALFQLHESRWNNLGEPGVLSDPRIRRFHEQVAAEMHAAGHLRLYALQHDNESIAVFYGFAYTGRMYSYLTGIEPSVGYFSPGTNLLRYVIERAIEDGLHEFDMLRGEESYKYLWGAVGRQNHRLTLQRTKAPQLAPTEPAQPDTVRP